MAVSTIYWKDGTSSIAGKTDGAIIGINKASSSYTHTLKYSFGNQSGTIISKTTLSTYPWTIPITLLNEIPNTTSGTGVIICDTYNGSTRVGTSTLTLNVTVGSSVHPTMTGNPTVIANNASLNSTVQNWGVFIAGYSKAIIEARAVGEYGSTIKKYEITGAYTNTIPTSILSYSGSSTLSSGTKTFYVNAIDSRGRETGKVSTSVTVLSYSKPTVTWLKTSRDSYGNMRVTADWEYSSVGGRNSITTTLRYRKKGASTYTTYSGSIPKNSTTTLSASFDEASSYEFEITIRDKLGNTATKSTAISTKSVMLDFPANGKGLGIGKISEKDGLEVNMGSYFLKSVSFSSNAHFNGTVNLNSTINLNGTAYFDSNAYFNSPVNFSSSSRFDGGNTFNGSNTFNSNVDFYRSIYYGKNASFRLPVILYGKEKIEVTERNAPMTKGVAFATPFNTTPTILLTINTSNPTGMYVSYAGISEYGFNIVFSRPTLVDTVISWVAIQNNN